MIEITVDEPEIGERLDKALALKFQEYSRSALEKLIENGQVLVNGSPIKTKYSLRSNDTITINFEDLEKEPEAIELEVLYEDENVAVINKPVGVLAHTKGAFSKEGTVATWLKSHTGVMLSEVEVPSRVMRGSSTVAQNDNSFWTSNRAGIVHRLDRGTSGVMIVAKNKATEDFLKGQFSKRNVKKTYYAVINGTMPEDHGLIDIPIERNPKKPATFRAGVNGKSAQTEFTVLKINEQRYSLVELKPITGRTHQLRVHLSYLKRPIVGDDFYNGEKAERLLLHAKTLEITLPGGIRKVFEAPVPDIFEKYVS